MTLRYLFGPVTPAFAKENLGALRASGECLAFGPAEGADIVAGPDDSWEDIAAQLPAGWRPDFVALWLPYAVVPFGLWSAPVPLVGLAADWNLNFHHYRLRLDSLDLVLTDTAGVEVFRRLGAEHVEPAMLFGVEPFLLEPPPEECERDIDVLFVGNFHPAVQRQRLPWLEKVASLSETRRVLLHSGAYGEQYRAQLRRAKVVFNRSIRGECNRRAFEAAAQGALLFQEEGNLEAPAFFRDRHECVYYTAETLVPLLEHYLDHDEERSRIAGAGRLRAAVCSFAALWGGPAALIESRLDEMRARAETRAISDHGGDPLVRVWQALGAGPGADPGLARALAAELASRPRDAALHNGLGLAAALAGSGPAEAAGYFRRALDCEPGHALAALNLAEALAASGQVEHTTDQARRSLALLHGGAAPAGLDCGHFPAEFDLFRVEWERCAWEHAGDGAAEARAKVGLLRWRLHDLLADLTGDLVHYHEAALARPDLPTTRAALGCALARAGRFEEAAPHLWAAVDGNPFDPGAARPLAQVLAGLGDDASHRRLAQRRRRLAQAAPLIVAAEPWFVEAPPVGDELASIVILCCGQLDYTRQCVESLLAHTRPPYELILVDNGSTDGTPAYLEEIKSRPGPARVEVITNATNLGFAAGCNQGLAAARGRYLVLLNNDTVLTAGWLDGLIDWLLRDWPAVGMVGPVTSYAAPPQQIEVDYRSPGELASFAAARRRDWSGKALGTDRLIGFCLAMRREALQAAGSLDEGFGLGFFEDDDLCLRVSQKGLRLLIALDVFVHHYGSRTFAGLGIDCVQQLNNNLEKFRAKWGDERADAYRLPEQHEGRGSRDEDGESRNEVGTAAPDAAVDPRSSIFDPRSSPKASPKVSLCMIVKNEEGNLGRCLRSAADLVDEMVVVDTGSADRTREVAAECGARVYDFAWVDSFAAARNESLRHAGGAWIFWLDADEFLDEPNRDRLRALFAALGGENVGYVMRQHSGLEGGGHAAAAVDQVRLFPNRTDVRWRYRVHEQILPALREAGGGVRHTDVVITHTGFADAGLQEGKVDRNLRLLELELAERPGDAFVLYNLGAVALTRGRLQEALEYLSRSLDATDPGDGMAAKLHALRSRCLHGLGRKEDALAACRLGRAAFAEDAELLFWEAVLLDEAGDPDGASSCLGAILGLPPGRHFMSADAGLRGYRTRHFLADVCRRQGRSAEAEAHWRAAVAECPDFAPAWRALADLYVAQGRWPELEGAALGLARDPERADDAALLRAQALLGSGRFAEARAALAGLIGRRPEAVGPRVLLGHVLLQEGADWRAAEQALRDVLALDPEHAETRHNLAVLLQRPGQAPAPESAPPTAAGGGPGRPMRVSLTMIVKDEEHNLPACLDSVADLVDEVVVVDTGSSDRTREIALRRGARVYDFPWVDHFAAARNAALRRATGDWVLWMDADDRLDDANRAKLRALLASLADEKAAYVMQCLCLPDRHSQTGTAVDHLRLFRNLPGLTWRYRIHEQILPAVKAAGCAVRWSGVTVQHTGYLDPALRRRKLGRDLRLLELERSEQPEDPFTLFNLAQVYLELGRTAEALPLLRGSLANSDKGDSIVRKLYALLAQAHNRLGQGREALAACRAGRQLFPEDAELLFQEGAVRRGLGDAEGAEGCWRGCLALPEADYFGSAVTGLRGYLSRHNLAGLCREQGRLAEAEALWRAGLAERPDYEPSWRGLADLLLEAGRWAELEALAARLEGLPRGPVNAACVRARVLLRKKEYGACRGLLAGVTAGCPEELEPRQLLSYALLQEGRDWAAAERALRDILDLDPAEQEARGNLAVLLSTHGRGEGELPPLPQPPPPAAEGLYRRACNEPSDIHEHCPTLCELARECRHVTELGTRTGVSAAALLYAGPEKLVCYDKVRRPEVALLEAAAGQTEFVFREADVLAVQIEETDLLFIDTWHVYGQLKEELRLHGGKARRYIVLHDTTAFADYGESPGHRGLWPAVEEFLAEGTFRLKQRYHNNNGLAVLERA